MRVEDSELDPRHDAYLAVISAHSELVGDSMLAMSRAAGTAARTLADADLAAAAQAMERVSDSASDFLLGLSKVHCPAYLRGAHEQLEGALRRIVRHSQHGAAAATARSGAGVIAAAKDMDTANDDILAAAQRLTDWRNGAARP